MKKNYIEIINSNLNKLDEAQLFKVLVLVQNTVDAVRKSACEVGMTVEKEAPLPKTKNRALYDGEAIDGRTISDSVYEEENKKIKKHLLDLGFSKGYGIFSLYGMSTEQDWENKNAISSFICFCIPEKMDGMIEINKSRSYEFCYRLSARGVDSKDTASLKFYNETELLSILRDIELKYKN